MKITLFWPPIPQGMWDFRLYPNLGAAYLAAVLREKHEVIVIDANLLHENTAEFYKDYTERHNPPESVLQIWDKITMKLIKITERTEPEILGIGTWSYNMPFAAEFTRRFKARNPEIPIIMGGINPTMLPDGTLLTLPYIDYLVRGEGEETIVELLDALSKKTPLNKIQGISFWKNNKVMNTPARPFIEDLDRLPFMDYENFIGFKAWNKNKMNHTQIMTSRGCVAKCTFCSVYQTWGAQRFYSDNYIIKQIKHLLDLYDYERDCVAFMDDNFVVTLDKTKKLIKLFNEKLPKHTWQIVDMRVEAMSEGFFEFIGQTGCEFAGFGVESIHSPSLKFFNKTITPEKYKQSVFKILDLAEKWKIRTLLSSILGTPYETEKDMTLQTNFFIDVYNKYTCHNFDMGPVVIHPGTDLWHKYKNGEIEIYRRPHHSPKRFYEGMYADKWDHLLEFVPNAYRITNTTMPKEKFENLLYTLMKETIFPMMRTITRGYERKKVEHINCL